MFKIFVEGQLLKIPLLLVTFFFI